MVILNFILRSYLPAESSLRSSYSIFPVSPQTGWCLRGKKQTSKMSETFIWSRKTLRSKGLQTHEIFSSITHPLWSSYLHPSLFCRGEDAPALCLQAASPLWGENKRMKEGTMVWKFKGCCQTYYAIRHKVFSVKLCVVTQFMRNLSLHFNVKTWNCTCGIHKVSTTTYPRPQDSQSEEEAFPK